MQTGFGMLEAGCVSSKNVANIMMKNVIDVAIGGLTYWSIGYALSFGPNGNFFIRWGSFATETLEEEEMGQLYSHYFFHFSFATAATTIVSGAVAERMKLEAYMIFSSLNILVYCLPASWAWSDHGFLGNLGFFDFAGACVVHLSGGASALVAAGLLGPRLGRFQNPAAFEMSSPVTALTGTFMLWWAWLAFNCGSTFGMAGDAWKIAALVAVTTINGSIGGSLAGLILSVAMTYEKKTGKYYFDVGYTIQGVLGGLVGITACCAVVTPRDAIVIGAIGGAIGVVFVSLVEKAGVDDPVGAVAVHLAAALWSTLSVGLFGRDFFGQLQGQSGLFYGGGEKLLLAQLAGVGSIGVWAMISTGLIFLCMKYTIGIRMHFEEEIIGADWTEHRASKTEGLKMEAILKGIQAQGITDQQDVLHALSAAQRNELTDTTSAPIRNFAGASKVYPLPHWEPVVCIGKETA